MHNVIHGPASLDEMQVIFDQAWFLLQLVGDTSPDRTAQDRDQLAAIIVKLMLDGSYESGTIAREAIDEFMRVDRRAS